MPQSHGRVGKAGRWIGTPGGSVASGLASAARSVGTATSTAFDVEEEHKLVATLNITATTTGSVIAGLDVTFDGTNWEDAGAWPSKAAVGTHRKGFEVGGAISARWRWTVATAAVTFDIRDVNKK